MNVSTSPSWGLIFSQCFPWASQCSAGSHQPNGMHHLLCPGWRMASMALPSQCWLLWKCNISVHCDGRSSAELCMQRSWGLLLQVAAAGKTTDLWAQWHPSPLPSACHPHHRQAPPSASRCEVGDAHPALTYPNTPRHGTSWKISLWAFSWFPSILAHSQAIPAYVTEQPGKLQSPHAIRCHGTSSMKPPAIPSPPHVAPWRKEEFLPRDWRRHARTPLTSITTQDLVVTLFQL